MVLYLQRTDIRTDNLCLKLCLYVNECGKRRKAGLQIASLEARVGFFLLGGNKLYNVHMHIAYM